MIKARLGLDFFYHFMIKARTNYKHRCLTSFLKLLYYFLYIIWMSKSICQLISWHSKTLYLKIVIAIGSKSQELLTREKLWFSTSVYHFSSLDCKYHFFTLKNVEMPKFLSENNKGIYYSGTKFWSNSDKSRESMEK